MLGFVADGAGVVEDEAGVGFVLDAGVTLLFEGADDFFGVMGVHLAAEGFDVEGLAHTSSIAAGGEKSTAVCTRSLGPGFSCAMAMWLPLTQVKAICTRSLDRHEAGERC